MRGRQRHDVIEEFNVNWKASTRNDK